MISKLLSSIAFLFILTTGSRLYADLEFYQYDGDVPMIEMMLEMATSMGILDKVPGNYIQNSPYRGAYYYPPPPSYYYTPYGPGPNVTYPPYPNPGAQCKGYQCGNNTRTLNGIWISQNREMLMIENNKILWIDASQNYLQGLLQVRNGFIQIRLQGINKPFQYQYKMDDNKLMIRDQKGVVSLYLNIQSAVSNNSN
ncbi:MAG: hypothetical protein GY781_18620 [Gammaproteobacteria bacterium]|nr:hypothetical protein [Gammaproteobacteria bacterium]